MVFFMREQKGMETTSSSALASEFVQFTQPENLPEFGMFLPSFETTLINLFIETPRENGRRRL
jgi:hypothetical protein